MTQHRQDIGARIKADVGKIVPQSYDDSADIEGSSLDRLANGMPGSLVMVAQAGAASGSPTAQSIKFVLQDSADDSTWADFGSNSLTVDADNEILELDVDLSGARRYVRILVDSSESSFTGGTSPANTVAGHLIAGGFDELPQN